MEKVRKRKHTRAGNRLRQAKENFSRKSITQIKDKTGFLKVLSHQGESSSFKGRYDKHSKPRVRGNSELDTP